MEYPNIWGVNKESMFMDKEPADTYEQRLDRASDEEESKDAYYRLGQVSKRYNVNVENLFMLLHRG